MNIYSIYDKPCSKIVEFIHREGGGGFLCSNCHSVFHSRHNLRLSSEIYRNKIIEDRFLGDYYNVIHKFRAIPRGATIDQDPLNTEIYFTKNFGDIINAMFFLSNNEIKITHKELERILGMNKINIFNFLKKNDAFFSKYIIIKKGIGGWGLESEIRLTRYGIRIANILGNFKSHFNSL